MPSFDVVSELDMQEVRNAVDQASREIATRYDFKGTDSSIDLDDTAKTITLRTVTEVKAQAVYQVLEEKLVKRKVSTKALDPGKVEDASGGTVRQVIGLQAGISDEKAKAIAKHVRELKLKGVQAQIQGDQLRITGKQRDDLQQAMQAMREHDFGIPLQFTNRRD
jgi:cyclic-di-GMP-binding protein